MKLVKIAALGAICLGAALGVGMEKALADPISAVVVQDRDKNGDAIDGCFTVKCEDGVLHTEALRYLGDIKELTIPESVKEVQPNAISNCASLLRVNIKAKVISEGAISECSKLSVVNIDADSVASGVVSGCNTLSVVNIKAKNIAAGVVRGCNMLSVVNIKATNALPGGVVHDCEGLIVLSIDAPEINRELVYECANLSVVNIKTTGTIPRQVFRGAGNLSELNIEAGYVEADAFSGYGKLSKVNIKANTLKTGALQGCTIGSEFNIDANTIETEAIQNCRGSSVANIKANTLNTRVFQGCFGFSKLNIEAEKYEQPMQGSGPELIFRCGNIPLINVKIRKIPTKMITLCENLSELNIDAEAIEQEAILKCNELKKININARTINSQAISQCKMLSLVNIKTDIVPQCVIWNCGALSEVNIDAECVSPRAIMKLNALSKIYIKGGTLSTEAITKCPNLSLVSIDTKNVGPFAIVNDLPYANPIRQINILEHVEYLPNRIIGSKNDIKKFIALGDDAPRLYSGNAHNSVFYVDPKNKYYKSDEYGALYGTEYSGTVNRMIVKLISFPTFCQGKFVTPYEVERICAGCFCRTELNELIITNKDVEIDGDDFIVNIAGICNQTKNAGVKRLVLAEGPCAKLKQKVNNMLFRYPPQDKEVIEKLVANAEARRIELFKVSGNGLCEWPKGKEACKELFGTSKAYLGNHNHILGEICWTGDSCAVIEKGHFEKIKGDFEKKTIRIINPNFENEAINIIMEDIGRISIFDIMSARAHMILAKRCDWVYKNDTIDNNPSDERKIEAIPRLGLDNKINLIFGDIANHPRIDGRLTSCDNISQISVLVENCDCFSNPVLRGLQRVVKAIPSIKQINLIGFGTKDDIIALQSSPKLGEMEQYIGQRKIALCKRSVDIKPEGIIDLKAAIKSQKDPEAEESEREQATLLLNSTIGDYAIRKILKRNV